MNDNLKDWQIAQIILGSISKKDCKLIKRLRKNGVFIYLDDYWSIVTDKTLKDDYGWLIPNYCINKY